MTDERHSPTTAAPTPPVTVTSSTPVAPAGAAAPSDGEPDSLPFGLPPDRPEFLVGAAFAGGLVAAIILKRLGGD